jgi:hypothetical protein
MAILGVIGLIIAWVFYVRSDAYRMRMGVDGQLGFSGVVMALASAGSLMQIIVFLGYGLVNVPMHLYCMSNIDK